MIGRLRIAFLAPVIWMALPVAAQQAPPAAPPDEDIVAAAKRAQTPQALQRMAREIQKQILSLNDYGVFDDIRFGIKDGVVTLQGYASRPQLQKSAEQVVKKVEGVEKVVNEIKILPNSPMDDRIRARVFAAIYYNPTLSRYNPNRGGPVWVTPARIAGGITNDPPIGYYPIHIIVDGGRVKLIGVVDTAMDQQIAYMQANSVSGVFAVDNEIQVAKPEIPKKKKK
jgi:hyperosmotically inducible periplasmic protein